MELIDEDFLTRLAALCANGGKSVLALSLSPALGGAILTAGIVSTGFGASDAEAKTPGKTYCYNGVCHRVKTLAETKALVGKVETLHTSHYDDCKKDRFNPCGLTSSGEVFRANTPDNAASPTYPNGTVLLIWSPATKKSAVVRVNNAGPYWRNRKLDVSRATAQKLGFAGQGVAQLKVRVLAAPTRAEASYKRNRRYAPVPGYIGAFASLDEAHIGAAQTYAVAALTAPAGAGAETAVAALNPVRAEAEALVAETATPAVVAVRDVTASARSVESDEDASRAVAAASVAEAVDAAGATAAPVRVAALIDARDVSEADTQRTPNSARDTSAPKRVRAEARERRNSRTYRTQKRQQTASRSRTSQSSRRQREVAVAEQSRAPRQPKGIRPITSDPTNDMSVFSRHTTVGSSSRFAARDMGRRTY